MRPEMTTAQFWAATAERAVKTMAQVAAALIGTGAAGVTELDWAQIGSVAATAAVVSVLTSLASDRVGRPGPSLVGEAITVRPEFLPIVEVEAEPATGDLVAQALTAPSLPVSTPAVYPLATTVTPDRLGPVVAATQPASAATPEEIAARSEVTP